MIIAERKPIMDIYEMLTTHENILVVGCGSCVTICLAGGEKEVRVVASLLKLKGKTLGRTLNVGEVTVTRQCENEWVSSLEKEIGKYDAVLSLGCGVGVQYIADRYSSVPVYPGLNTTFMGGPEEQGVWMEYCRGCGNCRLHLTGGICPVTKCSKNLLNGPCGGTTPKGKCEVDESIDCAWYQIFDRLGQRDELDIFSEIRPPNDWRPGGHKGPRKIIREDLQIEREGDE